MYFRNRMEFALGEYTTKESVIRAINATRYKGGNTATGQALTFLREVMFGAGEGGRTGTIHLTLVSWYYLSASHHL